MTSPPDPLDAFRLDGRVAIVTGASSGLGARFARVLDGVGARVVLAARRGDRLEALAAELSDALPVEVDLTDPDGPSRLVEAALKRFGQIDIVVGNAAVNPYYGSNLDIPDSAMDKILQVNICSNLWLAQMTFPEMRERKDGVFIIVSSIGGLRASTKIGAYCVSKAADMQLVRNLAAEFGQDNIRVNCIAPGLVQTNFARALYENPEIRDKRISETPMARLGDPEDIAGIAVYLASRAGAWTSGQTFAIDGGVTTAGTG